MSKVCVVTGGGSGMGLAAADLLHINALGTVYVNQEFSKRMHKGSVIVDIASMLAFSCENRMGTPEELGFCHRHAGRRAQRLPGGRGHPVRRRHHPRHA